MTDAVIITSAPLCSVEIQPPDQPAIEVGLTTIGLQGPQGIQGPVGPAGPNEIGGIPVELTNPQENDTLLLKTAAWRNTPQEALTDGGNF